MLASTEEYVQKYERAEVGIEEAIREMHDSDLTIVQSIFVVARVYKLDPLSAKKLVTAHPSWEQFATDSIEFHNTLIDVFGEAEGERSPKRDNRVDRQEGR